MLSRLILLLTIAATTLAQEPQRTWTSADGRTLQASLQSLTDGQVTLRLTDGRTFTLDPATFSPADQTYVQQYQADQARLTGFESGPYADSITGEWVKFPKDEFGLVYQIYGSKELKRSKDLIPLFIHLHGAGARADDVEIGKVEIAPTLLTKPEQYDRTPCVVIVPLCPPDVYWGEQVPKLEALIDHVINSLPIDRQRIYLSGYSMGARGIGALLESRPQLYAGALFADGEANPEWAQTQTAALWMTFSGERDLAKAKATADAYTAAGKTVRFDPHPDHIHNQIHYTLAKNPEVFDWLFPQKRK